MTLANLATSGFRLSAFGMKVSGLKLSAGSVVSADSLAWFFTARRPPVLTECEDEHRSWQNYLRYARGWRSRLLGDVDIVEPPRDEAQLRFRLF